MLLHIGDKVKIVDAGKVYTTYRSFFDYYRQIGHTTEFIDGVIEQYAEGISPDETDADMEYVVCYLHWHGDYTDKQLAVINNGLKTFIIGVEGLELISSDLCFHVGDIVRIRDTGNCYSLFDDLIKANKDQISEYDEVWDRFAMGRSASSIAEITDPRSFLSLFKVVWAGHHPTMLNDAHAGSIAVITNSKYTFVMGFEGLELTGESSLPEVSWDKYIIYVRNWAVVNKDSAQSVRDAAGPKSYAEWLKSKNKS